MLSESLRVPYRADDATGTLLVGSVLTFLTGVLVVMWTALLAISLPVAAVVTPLVVLPSLVMRGYLLAVVDGGRTSEGTVPSFVRWGSLVRAGSKSTLISAIYFFPGAVLCGLAVGGGVATAVSPPGFDETMQALTGVVILVSGFGLLIYGLVYLYVRPAARAVFAATDSVRAALGVRRVLRLSLTPDYLTGWLIAMGILVAGPTVILPLFLVGFGLGTISLEAGVVLVLAAFVLSFGLTFVCRVSAAWATGQGSTAGLNEIYPDTVLVDSETETVMATTASEPETAAFDRSEASSAVQTGRTVRKDTFEPQSTTGSTEDESGSTEDNEIGPTDDMEADDMEADDIEADDTETVDAAEEDHGFIWGNDEP